MSDRLASKLPFHYAWAVVGSGMLGIMAALGLGRFALGMMLPSMGSALNLNYSQMGYISTANFVGYMIAVFLSGSIAMRVGPSRLVFASLAIAGGSMLFISGSNAFLPIMALYLLTGLGSGGANVPIMGLVSAWFARKLRGRAAGFMVIGSGFAIMLSGFMVPRINAHLEGWGWRVNWMVLGALVLVISAICRAVLRDKPEEMGLRALGDERSVALDSASQDATSVYRERRIYDLGILYFLFGFTYVVYATFIVTSLVKDRGMSESVAGGFWIWVGLLSLLSGPVFGTLSDKLGRRAGLIAVFTLQSVSYLFAALGLNEPMLYASVACFGISAWSIPSIMAAAVGDIVGASRAPQAFGLVTFIFSLGQISGPAAAGLIAERTGGFPAAFYMTAALAALAAALTFVLLSPRKTEQID